MIKSKSLEMEKIEMGQVASTDLSITLSRKQNLKGESKMSISIKYQTSE